MSITLPSRRRAAHPSTRADRTTTHQRQRHGIALLAGIVALMWVTEVVNTLDGNRLDRDGLYARDLGHLWGILTAPFIHASFQHLLDNTIPFVFMGLIIALYGAARLAIVTGIVIVLGGIGTWLIAPAHIPTIGASEVVVGYATYLLTRGLFDRSALEVLTGVVVGVVWGGALLASLVPHYGVSWQAHVCGGTAGVIVAWLLAPQRRDMNRSTSTGGGPRGGREVAWRERGAPPGAAVKYARRGL